MTIQITRIEDTACPICRINLTMIWHEQRQMAGRCPQCGLIIAQSPHLLEFDANYFRGYKRYLESPPVRRARISYYQQTIASLPVELSAPVLDIGAGLGFFIRALPPILARETILVEPSAYARNYLDQLISAGVFSSLDQLPPDSPPFATVAWWDVLAHVDEPLALLKQIRQLMQIGGLLIVKTPHHPQHLFRAAQLLVPLKKGHSLLHIPSMRFHFTPDSLAALIRTAGFRVEFWQWLPEPPIAGRMGARHLKSFLLHITKQLVTGNKVSFIMVARA